MPKDRSYNSQSDENASTADGPPQIVKVAMLSKHTSETLADTDSLTQDSVFQTDEQLPRTSIPSSQPFPQTVGLTDPPLFTHTTPACYSSRPVRPPGLSSTPNVKALLVGINYSSPPDHTEPDDWPSPLSGPMNDVKEMKKLLMGAAR